MKNKWFLLAMVFLALLTVPVFAVGPTYGDGIYVGKPLEEIAASATFLQGIEPLVTTMEAGFVATGIAAFALVLLLVLSGPATVAPERYDKFSGFYARKWRTATASQGRFERQGS